MKSRKLLNSFTEYCKEHPEQRFWQALVNWSKYNYIVGSKANDWESILDNLEDVFYK